MEFQSFDIGIVEMPSLAAWFQKIYARRFNETGPTASHCFIFKDAETISEADGFSVHAAPLAKYLSPKIKLWVFRYENLTDEQRRIMSTYITAAENVDGRYSWEGIWDFVKAYFTGKRIFQDPRGVFCSDYVGSIIISAGLPHLETPPWEVTPTEFLQWILREEAWQIQ
jgi:hypothetical protein